MEESDELYKAFLGEMEALERFRIAYGGLYPGAPLAREDQDVKRLIEAMAMFTARTRAAGQRAIARSTMRLFAQHFPYVLAPLPAMATLQARVDARFVEIADIPRGTEVVLSPMDPPSPKATPSRLRFRTVAPLRLLPLSIERVDIFRRGAQGFRITLSLDLTFSGAVPSNKELGTLKLYVNHLNDFMSSLLVFHHLKKNLRHTSAVFDDVVTEETKGAPCPVRFGAPAVPRAEVEAFEHPIQRARMGLHYPEQELFLEVDVPTPPRNWRRLTLCFDVGPAWPVQLRLSRDAFELHSVQMVNVTRDMANPVIDDGTKERYLVQHPDSSGYYRMLALAGVYRLADDGMIPLRPGVIDGRGDSYEVEHEGLADKRRTWLSLQLADAFDDPVKVAVDAHWHQPIFASVDAPTDFRVTLADRHLEGVSWGLAGPVVAGTDNRLAENQDGLLRLLSIKNQRFLGLDDVVFLLEALGVKGERHFRDLVGRIASIDVTTKPFVKSSTGFKYIYAVKFLELDPSMLPVVDLFAAKLLRILGAWSTEDVVELEASVPNLEVKLAFSTYGGGG